MQTNVIDIRLPRIDANGEILDRPVPGSEWEALADAGREALANMDTGRWTLGDLAVQVECVYKQGSIEQWSADIGAEVSRIRAYRTVAAFWDRKATRRDSLLDCPLLTWTHFRDAMRMKELARKEAEALGLSEADTRTLMLEKATEFLETCAREGWTITRARIELAALLGKPEPPAKLVDAELQISSMPQCRVIFTLSPDQHARLIDAFVGRRPVRLVITEIANAEFLNASPAARSEHASADALRPDDVA